MFNDGHTHSSLGLLHSAGLLQAIEMLICVRKCASKAFLKSTLLGSKESMQDMYQDIFPAAVLNKVDSQSPETPPFLPTDPHMCYKFVEGHSCLLLLFGVLSSGCTVLWPVPSCEITDRTYRLLELYSSCSLPPFCVLLNILFSFEHFIFLI